MSRILSLTSGALALLTTAAVLCTQIAISTTIARTSPGRPASIVSAVFESAVLILLGLLIATDILSSPKLQSRRWQGILFGLDITACTLGTATSVVALVYLAKTSEGDHKSLLVGSSVALGLALFCQLVFTIFRFTTTPAENPGGSWSFHKDEESGRPRRTNLKAIRYSQTMPIINQATPMAQLESQSRPTSTDWKSTAETIRSSMNSVSQAMRPLSSRSRGRASRERGRSMSVDSNANGSSCGDDAFDNWDTSNVDSHNRQAVLEISTPTQAKTCGLETIPASPVASRSPTPESFADLEPPRLQTRRRSRSFSPVSIRRELRDLPGSNGEAHIHPLFRSDSPDPHPFATPGTIVMAAPDAVRAIVHRASNKSLNRMRSDSLPVVPSPLSKQGSFEESRSLRMRPADLDLSGHLQTERTMTPPVPDWLLSGR